MEQRVKITQEESDKVYNLFSTHLAYMNILQYLMSTGTIKDTVFYDRKWNEAIEINIKLDAEKRKIEKKYKPAGNWDRFEFDFENNMVVFYKE